MEQLFVYGTLRDPAVQERIIGRVIAGRPETLLGYGKGQVLSDGAYYPIAVPTPDASIEGMILDLTPEELARTDAYEGTEYRRIRVTLQSGLETWIYAE